MGSSKDLDQILKLMDEDKSLQSLMRDIAQDVHNKNEFLIHELTAIHNDDEIEKLLKILKEYIKKYKYIFGNSNTQSSSGRVNYAQIIFQAKDSKGNIILEKLAQWLAIYLISEHIPGIDEYVDNLDNFKIVRRYGLSVDNAGLVDLSNPRITIKNHALQIDENTLLYLHQFMRRYFGANFVGIPPLLRIALKNDYRVYARLDPLRSSTMQSYTDIIELDRWHGAPFNIDILNSDNKKEFWTVHSSDETRKEIQALGLSYPVLQTHFRTSMMDEKLRQFSIEEYAPKISSYGAKSPNFGKKYHIQKYAHFVYDQNRQSIEHVDCAVRVFSISDYLDVLSLVQQGRDPGRHIGSRYKLFKICGEIDLDFVQKVLYEFFRYNPHLMEYFCNKTFDEVLKDIRA